MSSASKPNILWVCTDAQRWDTIAAFGNPYIRTPAWDEVCRIGAGFRRVYTQNPMCTPARASMLTGRYPAAHHVYRNGNANFPGDEILVSKLLAASGYACGLVGKLHIQTARFGEDRQADGYSFFRWSKHAIPDEAIEYSDHYQWLKAKGVDMEALYRDRWTLTGPGIDGDLHLMAWGVEQCLEFIERNRHRRWMLSFNPMVPHLSEECWQVLGATTMAVDARWPEADPALTRLDRVTLAIQIDGKRRDEIELPKDSAAKAVEDAVLAREDVVKAIDGRAIKKVIIVPNRIVNVVTEQK